MVGKTAKLKTLIVIDSIFWVTGTMAEQIRRRFVEYDILVCSYATLKIDSSSEWRAISGGRRCCPLFHRHLFQRSPPVFHSDAAIIATIHHVEDESVFSLLAILMRCKRFSRMARVFVEE
jgi:hypothetical protein